MTTTPTVDPGSLTARVAEEIRALMGRKRVSGAALARSLGVSEAWISYRLSGKQTIDLHDLERIADVLHVAPVMLLPPDVRRPGSPTEEYSGPPVRPRDTRPAGGPPKRKMTGPPNVATGVRRSRVTGTPLAVAVPARVA